MNQIAVRSPQIKVEIISDEEFPYSLYKPEETNENVDLLKFLVKFLDINN
jgi:hypothetical protein